MKTETFTISVLLLIGTSVWAHEGVKNLAVKARMNGMITISENMKTVGEMAKGTIPFDAQGAQAALVMVSNEAANIPELFSAQEDDPKSEALPEIWETFDDFTLQAIELEEFANKFSMAIASSDDLRSALVVLGKKCTSCHGDYRK